MLKPYLNNIRNEWVISRKFNLSIFKSLIPLYILLFLSWYTSFLDKENTQATVGINTTVFLAGVALYFSAEKPRNSKLTIIDKFFIGFYVSLGTLIISEFSIFIGDELYEILHKFWQSFIPILFVLSFIFLFRKYKYR